jgi:hypothetical protein
MAKNKYTLALALLLFANFALANGSCAKNAEVKNCVQLNGRLQVNANSRLYFYPKNENKFYIVDVDKDYNYLVPKEILDKIKVDEGFSDTYLVCFLEKQKREKQKICIEK